MGLISNSKKQKQDSNKNNTKTKTDTENKAIVGVCSAGVKFCSRAEVCSPSFSLIMLRCGGFEWPWVRDSLAYGGRVVCLSRVVDYSSLVMHGRIPPPWEI